jgi:hypothetical protein
MNMQRDALMDRLLDRDIDHIRAAILWALDDAIANPLLTAPYWRRRIGTLMRLHHLSKAQLIQVDAILAIIDQLDLMHPVTAIITPAAGIEVIAPDDAGPSLSHCHPVLPVLLRCTFPSHFRVNHS